MSTAFTVYIYAISVNVGDLKFYFTMTSAEPFRRAPYSCDLRWRVVWQRIAMELPYRKIASNLNIAFGTAVNIYCRFSTTGKIEHSKDKPSLYLSEMCQLLFQVIGKEVTPSTICGLVHKHGFTRKKIQHVAKQLKIFDFNRGQFLAEIQFYRREQFVFIDETGCNGKDCSVVVSERGG